MGLDRFRGSFPRGCPCPGPRPTASHRARNDRYGNVAAFLHDALVVADDLVDFGQFDSDGPDGIPNSGERQYWNQVNADADHKGVDLEEADGYDDLDHSNNRGDAGDPFPGSAGTTEFTSTTYPGSDAHRGDSPCTVGVRSIRMRGSTASFVVTPAERLKVLGDADGSLSVDENDVYEAYWYALGWLRPGSAIQVDNADVDGDGDVDIRDGFLIDAFWSGYRVPVEGMGVRELVVCEGGAGGAVVAPDGLDLGVVEGTELRRLSVRSVAGQPERR